MKLLLLCVLFAPIIYLAVRQKKWYLYLAVAFVGILPEQLAIKIHDALPLLSVTRVLILVLMVFWILDKIKTRKFYLPKTLLVFLAVNILISLVNFWSGADEIKRIFLYIFERVLLILMIADLIDTRQEFETAVDFLILGGCALAVIGIVQTIFEYDIASVMHLQETLASIVLERRMGMLRAYGTFNAITFGCYCAFLEIPVFYRMEQTGKQRYAVAFALIGMALVCTFTRSAWLALGGVFLVLLCVRRGKAIRRLLPALGYAVLICAVLCAAQPRFGRALLETGASSINTILNVVPESMRPDSSPEDTGEAQAEDPSDPDSQDKPQWGFELDEDFGINGEDPSYSRMAQWTAVGYMAREGHLLFGYGYNALPEGRLHFFFDRWLAQWEVATFLDVGFVALITESGIVGAAAMMGLLAYMFIVSIRKRDRSGRFDFYKVTLYLIPLFLLLNFLAAFMFDHIVWLFMALFYAYDKLHSRNLTEPEPAESRK